MCITIKLRPHSNIIAVCECCSSYGHHGQCSVSGNRNSTTAATISACAKLAPDANYVINIRENCSSSVLFKSHHTAMSMHACKHTKRAHTHTHTQWVSSIRPRFVPVACVCVFVLQCMRYAVTSDGHGVLARCLAQCLQNNMLAKGM